MKRLLTLLIVLMTSVVMYAQDFIFYLQKDYTFATEDGKSYYVFEKPGKTASELYKETLVALSSQFNSPKDVISNVENEMITVLGILPGVVVHPMGPSIDAQIRFIYRFKDGKIRVDAPELVSLSGPKGVTKSSLKMYGVFNPQKKSYNTFHSSVNSICTCFEQPIVDEDW